MPKIETADTGPKLSPAQELANSVKQLDDTPDQSKTNLATKLLTVTEFKNPSKIKELKMNIYKTSADGKKLVLDSNGKFAVKGNVIQEVFRQMPTKQAQTLLSYINLPKTDPKYSQTISFLNNEI